MLMLKLQRIGKKHQASYRLIVGEKREKLDGAQLEDLGWYDPHAHKSEFKKDRVLYWISKGAGKSDTVHNLLISAGIIEGKKIKKHKQAKAEEGALAPAQASAEKTAEPKAA
jgi:small subunit ribosomal protein S16